MKLEHFQSQNISLATLHYQLIQQLIDIIVNDVNLFILVDILNY